MVNLLSCPTGECQIFANFSKSGSSASCSALKDVQQLRHQILVFCCLLREQRDRVVHFRHCRCHLPRRKTPRFLHLVLHVPLLVEQSSMREDFFCECLDRLVHHVYGHVQFCVISVVICWSHVLFCKRVLDD